MTAAARLRRIAARAAAGEPLGDDGPWLAEALNSYFTASGGLSLDRALGMVTNVGQPWWIEEAYEGRNQAFELLASALAPDGDGDVQADEIVAAVRRNESQWKRNGRFVDRKLTDGQAAALAGLFVSLDKMPRPTIPSARQIADILTDSRNCESSALRGVLHSAKTTLHDFFLDSMREIRRP